MIGRAEMFVVVNIPVVQLQEQPARERQLVVFVAAMCTLETEDVAVPATRPLDVGDRDEWLRLHGAPRSAVRRR